jgi:STE24 endopeptidase
MRDRAEKITKHPPLIIFLYWVQYLIAASILGAPLAIYEGFLREKQYQLMNQTFSAWVVDQLKELAVSAVLGGLAMMLLIGIVRRLPRTWHIWGAVAATVFVIIGALITPVFISPLFNKYQRLGAGPVRDSILRLARQNGIPANDVYEVDASRQSNRISANVSGFLGTERITLNDNLLKRCSSTCVEAVMGHEMGHYVLNHIYKMILYFGVVFAVFFTVLRRLLHWAFDRWGATWELRDVSDPAVLPLAALILSSLFFVFTPINNTWIRTQEYEADIFGLNTSRQPDGFAEAALLLSEYRKLEPGPVEEFLFFDHPSGRTRISSAMRWKAENQPQP